MSEKVVALPDFVDQTIRPVAEQIAGAGMPAHLLLAFVPAGGVLRVYSGLAPGPRADLMDQLAEQLRAAADQLRRGAAPSIFAPGHTKIGAMQ